MGKDLRGFLKQLEEKSGSGGFIRITKPVEAEFGITAILQKLEDRNKFPAVLFENVVDKNGRRYEFPVLANLFAARERLAMAIDSTPRTLAEDYAEREKPLAPVVVSRKDAPVKEIIARGSDVDLSKFPVVTHHAMDLGPYITAGDVWVKDPETGDINCAVLRIWASGKNQMVANWNPARHTNVIYRKYLELGKPMPFVTIIGHHPAFYMGAQTKTLCNEPEIIGGVMGEPLEVVPSETWGDEFMVPARAEVVIEGEVMPGDLEVEAPFGEFTLYYGAQKLSNVVNIRAITHRKDAIYLDVFAGHRDHLFMDVAQIEAALLNRLKWVARGVQKVYVPPSGCCRFHAYISMKKMNDGEPRSVIATALTADFRLKHVIVVDDDVDVFDEEEVLWAVATRSQWDKDLLILPRVVGIRLDPSADETLTCKAGIDATKPAPPKPFLERISVPEEALNKIRLEDYVDENTLRGV